MAKKFGVKKWLLPACVALVERQSPLTYSEAEKLGLGTMVLISEAREKYIQQLQNELPTPRSPPGRPGLYNLSKQYNLPGPYPPSPYNPPNSYNPPSPYNLYQQPAKNTTQLVKTVFGLK